MMINWLELALKHVTSPQLEMHCNASIGVRIERAFPFSFFATVVLRRLAAATVPYLIRNS